MPGNRTTGDAPEFFSIDPIELIGIGLVGDEPAGAIRGDTREVLTQDFGDLIRILREHKVPEEAI
ncbi:hypothetical protein J6T66_03735 [bacterium]|nr:hypothetical protein [bacterium]